MIKWASKWSSRAFKFWIKERKDEIKYLKDEIKLYQKCYKQVLKEEMKGNRHGKRSSMCNRSAK